ncbi:MAG: hypothetical protein WB510_11875 [Candidatus Sulfotelmatobacter sp.]
MADGSRTSPEINAQSAWVRLLLPSAADLIFVAILSLLVLTALSVRLLGDAGIGWHIRTGQQILSTHTIPRVDSFSSIMKGKPWFAWEWLYDVLVGWLERVAGLNGVVLFTAVIIAAVFAWTFRLLVQRGTNVLIALGLVLLAASASMIHFLARPHVLSWLLTLVWFWILDSSEARCFRGASKERGERSLWLLPPLMLLWANVHGGFLIGFVLLGVYLVSASWTWARLGEDQLDLLLRRLRTSRRVLELAVVSALAAAATFVNPYGWKLHAHIYQYLSNRFLMNHIEEFQSPNFHGAAEKCFAVLLLIALVALAARGRELRVSEGLVLLFAVYTGLYASRNLPVSSLFLVLVIGPPLSRVIEAVPRQGGAWAGWRRLCARVAAFSTRIARVETSLCGHLWPLVAIALACGIAANGGRLGAKALMNARFGEKRFPVQAVDHLEADGDSTPVLAPDYWGGYLIYRLYPRVLVAVDDRHDLYGEGLLKSYLKSMRAEPGWEEFLEEHEIQRVLVPRGSRLDNLLREKEGWRITYTDQGAVLFEAR